MKKLPIIALSTFMMTAPALAETGVHYSTAAPAKPSPDLSLVFSDNSQLNVIALSEQEMAETKGAAHIDKAGGGGFARGGGFNFGGKGSYRPPSKYNFGQNNNRKPYGFEIGLGVSVGATSGHFTYVGQTVTTGQYNPVSHATAVVTGATTGAFSPIKGAKVFTDAGRNVLKSTVSGGATGYLGTKTTNYNMNIR